MAQGSLDWLPASRRLTAGHPGETLPRPESGSVRISGQLGRMARTRLEAVLVGHCCLSLLAGTEQKSDGKRDRAAAMIAMAAAMIAMAAAMIAMAAAMTVVGSGADIDVREL
jgi:hypothetical protein